MILRKCDRCGELVSRLGYLKHYIYTKEQEDGGFSFRTDLCPMCLRKLKRFLKGAELRGKGEIDEDDGKDEEA